MSTMIYLQYLEPKVSDLRFSDFTELLQEEPYERNFYINTMLLNIAEISRIVALPFFSEKEQKTIEGSCIFLMSGAEIFTLYSIAELAHQFLEIHKEMFFYSFFDNENLSNN